MTLSRTSTIAALAVLLSSPPLAAVSLANEEWELAEALNSGRTVGVHLFVSSRGTTTYDNEAAALLAPVAKLVADELTKVLPKSSITVLTAEETKDLKPVGVAMGWARYDYSPLNKDLILALDVNKWAEEGRNIANGAPQTTFRLVASIALFSKSEPKKSIYSKGEVMGWAAGIMFIAGGGLDKNADKLKIGQYVDKFKEVVAKKTADLTEEIGVLPAVSKIGSITDAKKMTVTIECAAGNPIKNKTLFWIVKTEPGDDPNTLWTETTHNFAVGILQVTKVAEGACEAKVKELEGAKIEEVAGLALIEKNDLYKKRWKL